MGYDPTGTWDWGTAFSGAGLLATGLTAIATAAAVLACGAAALVMVAVATVTAVAGALTAVNGAAEVVEAGTGYNAIRDGVLGGNEQAYEAYRDATSAVAEIGTVICGSYYAVKGGNVCFVEGTLVQSEQGPIPIETVTVGTMVWAWDDETGDVALKEVVETYINESDELVYIFVNGEEIVCTPSHPFYSPVKGWTDAVSLRAGDILVLVNGEYVVVEKVQHEILEAPVTVYNFQVEDYHTYYVTDTGILVHNKCGMTNREATSAANSLGYSKVPNATSHGNAVFTNPKATRALRYITADVDGHVGGVWKAADTISNLGSKSTRSGTYNALLEWIAP